MNSITPAALLSEYEVLTENEIVQYCLRDAFRQKAETEEIWTMTADAER